MIPFLLLAAGAGLIAGDVVGKASAKKQIEKPVYKVALVHKSGAVEMVDGSMLQAWGTAVEREVSQRGSADPIVSMAMETAGKVIRTWAAPALQGLRGWR